MLAQGVAVADGFLGRWSQRKQAAQQGQPLAEPTPPVPARAAVAPLAQAQAQAPAPDARAAMQPAADVPAPEAPALTLDDVQALQPESSYAPFVGRSVTPEVRNAAMKKLFTDPHYNVMDGLDIYIDDYTKPDPLPLSMLRQMSSAQFLNLFDEEPEPPALSAQASVPGAPEFPINPAPLPLDPPHDHDHPDLRLQPNDAAGPQDPGRGTE